MAEITTTQSFSDGDTVTATKLNNIQANASIQPEAITNRSAETTVDQANDLLLMYDASATALKKVTPSDLIKAGTASNLPITGNATIGGTLGVTGASTLTGNTSVGGTLGVSGAITASTAVINVGSGQIYKDSSGNVGVGTVSPASKLSVTGSTSGVSIDVNFSGGIAAGTEYSALRFTANSFVGSEIRGINTNGGTNLGNLSILTSGTERLRIDSSGNVLTGGLTSSPSQADNNSTSGQVLALNTKRELRWSGTNASIYGGNGGSDDNIYYHSGQSHIFRSNSTERLRIDSSGNVGIGLTSYSGKLAVNGVAALYASTDNNYRGSVDVENGNLRFIAPPYASNPTSITLHTGASSTERLRIDSSGNLLVGTTTTPSSTQSGFFVNTTGLLMGVPSANVNIACYKPSGAAQTDYQRFIVGGNQYGAISWNGATGTLYTTTSDYRLKENVQPMQNALATVALLRPVTYRWKNGNTSGQGFIAHELQEVVPDAVSGKKDEVETYKDEDGNDQTRPQYQGIDTSFLVATLTSAIQEQQAIITSLTERITALEAA